MISVKYQRETTFFQYPAGNTSNTASLPWSLSSVSHTIVLLVNMQLFPLVACNWSSVCGVDNNICVGWIDLGCLRLQTFSLPERSTIWFLVGGWRGRRGGGKGYTLSRSSWWLRFPSSSQMASSLCYPPSYAPEQQQKIIVMYVNISCFVCRAFRNMDDDRSRSLDYSEFKKAIFDYGLHMEEHVNNQCWMCHSC